MNKQEYKNMYQQENNFWWYKTLHNLIIATIKKRKDINLAIFDAGCGTGRLMELLSDYGTVSGIDYSEDAVIFSKKRGLKHISRNDLNDWEPTEKYDVITSIDVLYHSAIKDDYKVLQKFYDGLSTGGTLILNLAAFNILRREHDVIVHTKRRYRKKTFVKKLEAVGFCIEKATYRMPLLFLIILLQKLIHKIFPPKKIASDVQETPKWINAIFYFLGKIENSFILKTGSIPFGSSLFIIAKKESL
ncbi:class I SAM-dependent methyltransferase [Flavivirga spongiicola]|uniref:Class I SAM-dependent methyltransferase n=1 Tax=Flavivirga spongiicola TaxID=421621 RepID=A0ABU7XP40_9FLAO|nr:class I SAM-dependent methyltransferase [Flavivirga sp. MEBiC05379]MDO5977540.1 class I SAM-dependent methyltransferase [Flavivirga sp. MEBiC05379]